MIKTQSMRVPFSYLDRQFADVDSTWNDLRALVKSGDFTLGKPLQEFEERFAKLCQMPYAVGVGTGTDAIILSLKMLGVGAGDEVITTPMTFIATVGAIVAAGAKPVFVDSEDGFVMDAKKIEEKISQRTKAIVPVHYTGNVPDMISIEKIAKRHKLFVVEDACQSIAASIDGKPVGAWGESACFSLHPLKNLNVWGDGGVVVTRSKDLYEKLRLYRNHGLSSRNEVASFGINCRLDTLQAVIGNRLIGDVDWITQKRIENAKRYDEGLKEFSEYVQIPVRRPGVRHVYHLYMIRVKERDRLLRTLEENGVEAKVHYPIPVHLQPAAQNLGYKKGDFPKCEEDCKNILTLPAHQHLTTEEIDYTIEKVRSFFKNS